MTRFRSLFGLEPVRDVDDEIAFHLEMLVRELVEAGESPERARELALRRFGDYEQARARCIVIDERRKRRLLRTEFFAERWQDVRFALRMFRRAPGVGAAAVLTLALGIGANAAVFSLFSQLLLQPLPVPEPDRLVNLADPGPRPGWKACGFIGECSSTFSYPLFRDLERVQTAFTGIAAHRDVTVNLGHRGLTIKGDGLLVSGDYFPVLGLEPTLGRLLGPEDDRAIGEPDVVVLTHAFWQTQFGGRPDALGETVVVNGHALAVVGIAPEGFEGTTRGMTPDVFIPITLRWRMLPGPGPGPENRNGHWVYLFARLAPGVTVEEAEARIDAPYRAIINDVEAPLQRELGGRMMAEFRARRLQLEKGSRGQSGLLAEARAPLGLLLGITTLVLLIACVNVANLLLSRAAARSREFATRLSIGASRSRLVGQLLTESAVLALVGGAAGLVVAGWTMGLVRWLLLASQRGPDLPLELDGSALIAAGALALGTSVVVGLSPALQACRPELMPALQAQAGQPGGGRRTARFRTLLGTAQATLSMVLLVLAGLFAKSLANVTAFDPGIRTDGVVTFTISPERNGYPPARSAELFARLEEDLAGLPGVTAVASSTTPLLTGAIRAESVRVEGFEAGPDTDDDTRYDEIGPGYFRTLGIPLIAGREFTEADSAHAPKVAVVNEQFARKFGLGGEVVGTRISRDGPGLDIEIVGFVRDFNHASLRNAVGPLIFVPHRQGTKRPGLMSFYVRTPGGTADLMPAVRHTVSQRDQHLPVEDLRTMEDQVRGAMVGYRLMGVLSAGFAALATLLTAIGLYGVLAYGVAQRTPEIGLRMALGASRRGVRWMVLRQVAVMAIAGATLGLALALPLARAARAMLFGLEFADPAVLAAAVLGLGLVALAAGYLPATRAARIDPMRALKHD